MSTMPTKSRSLMLTVVIASAAVGYVMLVFLPGQRALREARHQLTEKQHYILQADRLAFAIDRASRELEAARQLIAQWKASTASYASNADLIARLHDIATGSGVVVLRVEPADGPVRQTLRQSSITLQLRGDLPALLEFLRQVDTLPAVWVDDLELARPRLAGRSARQTAADGTSEQNLEAQITLTVFADNVEISG